MSDDKPIKAKRAAATSSSIPEAVNAALPESPAIAVLPAPTIRRRPEGADPFLAACQTTLAAIGEAQHAVAVDVKAISLEMSGQARAHMTAAGDGVAALFAARSLAEAVEIQLGFARRSLDAMAAGSTKLGELGLRLASDAARPMLEPFARG